MDEYNEKTLSSKIIAFLDRALFEIHAWRCGTTGAKLIEEMTLDAQRWEPTDEEKERHFNMFIEMEREKIAHLYPRKDDEKTTRVRVDIFHHVCKDE